MITRSGIRKAIRAYYSSYPGWGPEFYSISGVFGFMISMWSIVFSLIFAISNDYKTDGRAVVICLAVVIGLFPFIRWVGALFTLILLLPFKVLSSLWHLIPAGEDEFNHNQEMRHRDFPMEMEEEEEFDESKPNSDTRDGEPKQKRDYNISQFGDQDYQIVDDDREPISFEKRKRS